MLLMKVALATCSRQHTCIVMATPYEIIQVLGPWKTSKTPQDFRQTTPRKKLKIPIHIISPPTPNPRFNAGAAWIWFCGQQTASRCRHILGSGVFGILFV